MGIAMKNSHVRVWEGPLRKTQDMQAVRRTKKNKRHLPSRTIVLKTKEFIPRIPVRSTERGLYAW